MEKEDNKLKHFLQSELDKEADQIMEEVNKNPGMEDVVAPEEIFNRLQKQIREHEESGPSGDSELSEEEEELIRLGKLYKKKRSKRKYYVLGVAVICVLAFGMTSLGDGKKVVQKVKDMVAGKEQTITDAESEKFSETITVDEFGIHDEIEKKFGFYPVQMQHVPYGMKLAETFLEEEMQIVRLRYVDVNQEDKSILWRITTNNRTNSVGTDMEDPVGQEYTKTVQGTDITFKEYNVEGSDTDRWSIEFVDNEIQYFATLIGLEQEEVERVADNLYFP